MLPFPASDAYMIWTDMGDISCWKEHAAAIVGGTLLVAAAPVVLTAAGFTTGGVAAGSIAAGIQSTVYGGAVGSTSLFAVLQSAGAAGLGASAKSALFAGGAAMATWIQNKLAPCLNDGPNCSSDKQ
ncbi:interferon alpha-inducible protein 27-like protein 2A [Orbicella faveolata]|uniref:interferon alpha-inducible protein 27-like protein 2A n=1 Tax=Orbicella faveolata TaxID=48498 RepID=UPI0009E60C9B|nr:interferon alpha-inducible protein 27-like protein 2A [Orbicella faveolata]